MVKARVEWSDPIISAQMVKLTGPCWGYRLVTSPRSGWDGLVFMPKAFLKKVSQYLSRTAGLGDQRYRQGCRTGVQSQNKR
jgi:hypothetical protein